MHTPTHNPHKPILLFTTSIHTTIPKQRIGNYGVCGWKDRCRDGNLRTYCHVSPILFGCFFVEASPTCFCIFVKYIYEWVVIIKGVLFFSAYGNFQPSFVLKFCLAESFFSLPSFLFPCRVPPSTDETVLHIPGRAASTPEGKQ